MESLCSCCIHKEVCKFREETEKILQNQKEEKPKNVNIKIECLHYIDKAYSQYFLSRS